MLGVISFIPTVLLQLLLSACAQVPIVDHEFIGSLGAQGGAGFHFLNDTKTIYTRVQIESMWDDIAHPMCMTSADTIADWKDVIETLCSYSNRCSYEVQQVTANKMPIQKAGPEAQVVLSMRVFYSKLKSSTGT